MRSERTGSNLMLSACINNAESFFFTLSMQLLWIENVSVFLPYRQAKWTVGYVWRCLHATSVDNSAQCPAVVMLSVKTPLTSLSSPHVIPRPGCCALDHSYITDGRKCPVLRNCVQIRELSCDEAFVFISVHRGAEFQTAVKHRKFKKKSSSCLNYTTVAHVNEVKIFDYFRLFDVSNILILKINS